MACDLRKSSRIQSLDLQCLLWIAFTVQCKLHKKIDIKHTKTTWSMYHSVMHTIPGELLFRLEVFLTTAKKKLNSKDE